MYDRHVDIRNGLIVGKGIAHPAPAGESHADVAKAVIDATIEADVRAPIADVEGVYATDKTPISWCPEQTDGRRLRPGAAGGGGGGGT